MYIVCAPSGATCHFCHISRPVSVIPVDSLFTLQGWASVIATSIFLLQSFWGMLFPIIQAVVADSTSGESSDQVAMEIGKKNYFFKSTNYVLV